MRCKVVDFKPGTAGFRTYDFQRVKVSEKRPVCDSKIVMPVGCPKPVFWAIFGTKMAPKFLTSGQGRLWRIGPHFPNSICLSPNNEKLGPAGFLLWLQKELGWLAIKIRETN